eukprot:3257904-Pleurochrysis_carterae.AAC.1
MSVYRGAQCRAFARRSLFAACVIRGRPYSTHTSRALACNCAAQPARICALHAHTAFLGMLAATYSASVRSPL